MKNIISTERAPKAIGPYSQAVVANGLAFLSGQIPLDPLTNQIITGDIAAQTERVLENLKRRAGSGGVVAGAGGEDHRYLKDMDEFAKMNEVYGRISLATLRRGLRWKQRGCRGMFGSRSTASPAWIKISFFFLKPFAGSRRLLD